MSCNWQAIRNAFRGVTNFSFTINQNRNNEARKRIKEWLILVILATSESMRFNDVQLELISTQDNYRIIYSSTTINRNQPITNNRRVTGRTWVFFRDIVVGTWDDLTQRAFNYLQNGGNLNDWYNYAFIGNRRSIIRIFTIYMANHIQQCQPRSKRNSNNKVCYTNDLISCKEVTYFLNKNKELYSISCDSSEIKKVNIEGKVTATEVLDENNESDNLKKGTIYVGTTNGVYLIYPEGEVYRFDNLNFPIKHIILDGNGSAYVINDKSEIYHLNLYGWDSEKVKTDNICNNEQFKNIVNKINNKKKNNVITTFQILDENTKGNLNAGDIYVGTINGLYLIYAGIVVVDDNNFYNQKVTSIKNFSKDNFYATREDGNVFFLTNYPLLNQKQLQTIFLENVKSSDLNKELKLYYNNDKSGKNYNIWESTFQIPIQNTYTWNVGKINLLNNYQKILFFGSVFLTKASWGNDEYLAEKTIFDYFKNRKNQFKDIINHWLLLQSKKITSWPTTVQFDQNFSIYTYNKNNNNFLSLHLESSVSRLGCTLGWCQNGAIWFNVGDGIRLYNDDESIRTKREIFDLNKLEEKNITKWTDEFTKFINHKQHLSINNKTNFARNNITSL